MKNLLTNEEVRRKLGVEDDVPNLFNINELCPVNNKYMVPFSPGAGTASILFFLNEMNQLKSNPNVLKILELELGKKEFDPTEYLISTKAFCVCAKIDEAVIKEQPIGWFEYSGYKIYKVSEYILIAKI